MGINCEKTFLLGKKSTIIKKSNHLNDNKHRTEANKDNPQEMMK